MEKIVIRDTKGQGGVGGITTQESARIRWSLSRHIVGVYVSAMWEQSGKVDSENKIHKETQPAAMEHDEQHHQHHQTLKSYIKDNMTDPFDVESPPDKLINVSRGIQASDNVQAFLLSCVETGQSMIHYLKDLRGAFMHQ